ncbi:hypothetical protein PMAYCL1PPCAC_20116 [Pristionchus mayeri]|uniref:Proliferating cell nuclear antigen n=1 Tax=Pristionchus mayeri TaxID=1317129 RepID=A0AAN5I3V1_9BILA|nr:hypothetical protein PMAYCL1PPCAC_20116 [Pristionchus mayeri]
MFKATLSKTAQLKQIFDALKELVELVDTDQFTIECSPKSMRLMGNDLVSNESTQIFLELKADLFESYSCDVCFKAITSVDTMVKALDFCSEGDEFIINGDANLHNTVVYWIVDAKYQVQQEVTGTIATLFIEEPCEPLSMPGDDYSVVLSMPSALFHKTIKNLCSFTGKYFPRINIDATELEVTFTRADHTGKSENPVTTTVSFPATTTEGDGREAVQIAFKEPVTMRCSARHLLALTKPYTLSDRVTIVLGKKEGPYGDEVSSMMVQYGLEDIGVLRLAISPR